MLCSYLVYFFSEISNSSLDVCVVVCILLLVTSSADYLDVPQFILFEDVYSPCALVRL